MKNNNKGFTLAELMIVIAIVGVLIVVAIPLFVSQMEKSKQATDIANMRSAKAAAIADWLNEGSPDSYSKYYDAAKGIMTNVVPSGYGKSSKDSSTFASILNVNASGVPNEGAPRYVMVNLNSTGIVSMNWGGDSLYLSAISPYLNKSLSELHAMNNVDRVAADKATLTAIGRAILAQGWNRTELKNQLGIVTNGTSTIRIADYYQLKTPELESAGFVISGYSKLYDLLQEIGYDGGTGTDRGSTDDLRVSTVYSNPSNVIHTTYTNSLFYSDQLATNQYGTYGAGATMRCIIIQNINEEGGVIKSFEILSKAMDEQANLLPADKNLFKLTIN